MSFSLIYISALKLDKDKTRLIPSDRQSLLTWSVTGVNSKNGIHCKLGESPLWDSALSLAFSHASTGENPTVIDSIVVGEPVRRYALPDNKDEEGYTD